MYVYTQHIRKMSFQSRDSNSDDNMGKSWSTEEERNLIEEIKTLDIGQIANLHKRSIGSIKSRLRHIGCRMINDGITIHNVCEMLKLSETSLQKSLNLRKYQHQATAENSSQDKMISLLTEIRDLLKIIADK
jgi:hypothetical protein